MQLVDLFISQRVSETNRFDVELATNRIIKKLSGDCKIVWIPNIYFDGYFPQCDGKRERKFIGKNESKLFPNPDYIIDEIMEKSEKNPDVEKILDKISVPNFIPIKTMQDGIDLSLAELKKREWLCDVKISDYIENNIFGNRLFFSHNHPVQQCLFESARRILRTIDIKSDNFLDFLKLAGSTDKFCSLIGQDIPIYPSVLRFFDITEEPEKYYADWYHWEFYGNFRGFQREYIKHCWAEKFTR